MEENYMLAKEIVKQKFPRGSGIDEFLIIGLYGLLSKYSNHKDIVKSAFLDTDIYIEHGTLRQIFHKHNIELDSFKYNEERELQGNATYAVSSLGNTICLENGKLKLEKRKPFIVASIDMIGITSLLISFIHEMGHIIKGYNNGYAMKENNNIVFGYIRSGLCIDGISFYKDSNEYYNYNSMEILDEVVNVLQTMEAMQEIKALEGFIPDKNVENFFNLLNKNLFDKNEVYKKSVRAFKPLWESIDFKELIENNIVEGRLKRIKSSFDRRTYKGAFKDLGDLLDDIDESKYSGGDFIFDLISNLRIKRIINKYKKNKPYQKKK